MLVVVNNSNRGIDAQLLLSAISTSDFGQQHITNDKKNNTRMYVRYKPLHNGDHDDLTLLQRDCHHVLHESSVTRYPGDPYSVLPNRCCFCGYTVSTVQFISANSSLIEACTLPRQFISSTYPTLKQHNPDLPILIREAKGTPARVFARFGECLSTTVGLSVTEHVVCRAWC